MPEHLSSQQLEQYRHCALPPMDLLVIDDHLAGCERCREQLGELVPAAQAWQSWRASLESESEQGDHLGYEQLAAYVDDGLSGIEREAFEAHLEICRMCDAELQDLRAFSLEVAALPHPEPPKMSPAPVASRFNWRRRLAELLTIRRPVLASVGALLLLLVAWMIYFQFGAARQSPPEVATTTTPAPATPAATPDGGDVTSPSSVLALNDGGGRVALDGEGRLLTPQPMPPAWEQMLKQALTTGRVEASVVTGLNVKTGSLMGGGESAPFKLLEPVGRVIETNRPNFRWEPLAGAKSYALMVYDADFNRVTASPLLTENEWRPPQPLARGRNYSWQVRAIKDGREIVVPGPPAPEAKFRILEQGKADELARARRQHSGSHLMLGLLYAQAGMTAEAERELQMLAAANPDSVLPRRLLRSLGR